MSSSPISRSEALCLDLEAILGAPVLLADEDEGAYYRLRELVRDTIKPTDIVEAIWVRDVTDLTWEGLRYRRWKSAYHRFAELSGVAKIYYDVNGCHTLEARALIADLAAGSRRARAEHERTMKAAGYDKDVLAAAAFCASQTEFEFLDRMIAHAESRRDELIREVERRRAAVGRRLRDCVATADAEVVETDPGTPRRNEDSPSKPDSNRAEGSTPTAGATGDRRPDGHGDPRLAPWQKSF